MAGEEWKSSDGKVITSTFLSLEDDKITLRKSNGKQFTFALDRLSRDSRTRAKELARQAAGASSDG